MRRSKRSMSRRKQGLEWNVHIALLLRRMRKDWSHTLGKNINMWRIYQTTVVIDHRAAVAAAQRANISVDIVGKIARADLDCGATCTSRDRVKQQQELHPMWKRRSVERQQPSQWGRCPCVCVCVCVWCGSRGRLPEGKLSPALPEGSFKREYWRTSLQKLERKRYVCERFVWAWKQKSLFAESLKTFYRISEHLRSIFFHMSALCVWWVPYTARWVFDHQDFIKGFVGKCRHISDIQFFGEPEI